MSHFNEPCLGSDTNTVNRSPAIYLRVFAPFAVGYFLSYLYRTINAVIASDLTTDLGVGPSSLGLLTATYFIAFASFQLPLGALLDRYGARKVEAILLLFAGSGAFFFGTAQSFTGLLVGRALIGLGVSACLMAAFKAYTTWFSPRIWPMINGFQLASGGLGAIFATVPVERAVQWVGWRGVFLVLSALTFMAAAAIFWGVPENRSQESKPQPVKVAQGFKEVFTSFTFWRVVPLTTFSQAAFLSIQGLWAGPWLRDVGGLERTAIANLLFWVATAMAVGFMGLGSLGSWLSRRGVSLFTTAVTGIMISMLIQILLITTPVQWMRPIWVLFGFWGTSGILNYAALSQYFPHNLSGRVTTAVNMLVFVVAFFNQWLIGAIIELWPISADGGYALKGYQAGFSAVLIPQIVALGWYLIATRVSVRKSKKRQWSEKA